MDFKELNEITRKYMFDEFQREEQGGNPYRSESMSSDGLANVAQFVENAIKNGNEISLANNLSNSSFWKPFTIVHRGSSTHQRRINPTVAAKVFAQTEFNTWYVRGLAKKLMDEGISKCEIYRAEAAEQPRCECSRYEGQEIDVKKIYDGHRAKYHPIENNSAFSIPSGPNCHHAIRRLKK